MLIWAWSLQEPELFTTAPAIAILKAIANAGLETSQIDFYEINEAFSVGFHAQLLILLVSHFYDTMNFNSSYCCL